MSQSGQQSGRGGGPNNRGSRRGYGNWRGSRRGWRGQYGRGRGRGYVNRGSGKPRGRGAGSQPSSSQVRTIQSYLLEPQTPYKGWVLYLPDETYSENSSLVAQVKVMERYFATSRHLFNVTEIERNGFFCVDFKEISSDLSIIEGLPNLISDIKVMPERIISCLGLAMHQVITKELQREEMLDASQGMTVSGSQVLPQVSVPKIHCRITNFDPLTQLKNLRANCYGNFVSVRGTVVRVSNIKPMCTKMAFCCATCGTEQVAVLPDGKYILPSKCAGDSCNGRTFFPQRNHPMTETIDWQTIRVQEIMDDDQRESGRIPRTVDCELTHDLVDKCVPGDMVTVTGIVKVMGADDGNRGRDKDKCMFLLYVHANSVMNAKGSRGSSGEQSSGQAMEFTIKELYAIEEIHSEDNLFRLIVGSLCPSIYGHEMVKAGLVLGLFGGTHKYVHDKNRVPVRGDPHILVVGDPGLGKSQMLHACANVAPRSVYVCGNTTTTSGLTVTLSKEGGGSGDYALEAGALVLADQGCCCIDEFDKMGNQHQALLEAMEQQSISIAKAGIVCSLPARTSILAAANPIGGHYNKAKTVSENLKMGGALLSRFDLAFILLDKPDEEMDSMLSEHVMALHAGRKRTVTGTPRTSQTEEEKMAKMAWDAEKPLSERLKVARGESLDPIPPQLLRKYICYARKYVHPKISVAASKVIQKFYLDLRKMHQTQDCTPITTRQLESLIRLTEARARLELREEVIEQDSLDVVEIMKYSMIDTYSDQFGFLDFKRSQHGSGMSSRSQGKKFISLLQRISEQTYNSLFTVQEMNKIAKEANIRISDFESFVSSLNNQGYLLKKGPYVYQLQTAGF